MSNWNISFGRTAQFVVGIALLAIAGSIFFIYSYNDESNAVAPRWVDPFDRSDLTAAQQEFFRAVDKGDVRGVRVMLKGDPALAKLSIDTVGTPLHIAATRDMVDMARTLLDAGADLNAPGQWGGTPLHWAAWLGRVDTVRLFIERGADVERRCTTYGATPLLWASYGSTSADRRQYNRYGMFGARGFGERSEAERQAERARWEANPEDFEASRQAWEAERAKRRAQRDQDYTECVQVLIDAGADVNTKNREGVPAIVFGTPGIAQLLTDHGAKNDYVPPPPPATEPEEEPAQEGVNVPPANRV